MANGVRLEWNGLDRVLAEAGKKLKARRGAMLHDIGETLVNNAKWRFQESKGPDGKDWEPSARAAHGGKTLIGEGDLRRSITHAVTQDGVLVGSNKVYARIHQMGGTIRPKKGKYLKFKGQHGQDVFVKEVTIPARPYLGFNKEDREDVADVLNQYLAECLSVDGGSRGRP